MTDVLKLLPPFEWRGRKYPVVARTVSFAHESVQHKLQYRDGEIVEQTGARNPTFSYSIPMREDIARGPYKHLFTEGLPVLFRDMRLRESGPLVDQVYGPFVCVPTSFTDDADPNKRDGVDVKVEFILAPEVGEDQQLQPSTIQDVAGEANALDADLKEADWHQEEPPEGTTDIFSAINGLAFQGIRARDKISGLFNDVAFRLEKIETTVDRVTDPRNWTIRQDARRLRDAVTRIASFSEDPAQQRVRVVVPQNMPIAAAAALAKLTVEQLLALNPQLATSPTVPAGTKLRVPSGA